MEKENNFVSPEQTNNEQVFNTHINKSLKIANIIMLCIITAIEIYAIWCYSSIITVMFAKDLSGLAIIALLPLYLILTLIITALSIVMTVLANKWKNYLLKLNQPITIFDKILRYIGWIFTLVNVIGFAIIFII